MFKVFTDLSLPGLRWLKQLELPRQICSSTRRLAWAASHCGGLRVVNFSEILWLTFPRVDIPRDQSRKWKASSDLVLKVTRHHAWGWCMVMTQRDVMGREVGGGFMFGNACTPVVDSCQCMAKPIQYYKVK